MEKSEQLQGYLNFDAVGGETGYGGWVLARRLAVETMAPKKNLPLGHAVEIWLKGGIRLRGNLRLGEEVLFIEENRIQSLALMVGNVTFHYAEMDSCIRTD